MFFMKKLCSYIQICSNNRCVFILLLICFAGIGYFSYLETVSSKVDYTFIALFIFWGLVFLKRKLLNDGSRIYKASICLANLSFICFTAGFLVSVYKHLERSTTVEMLWNIFTCLVMLLYCMWSSKYLASSDKNSQVQKAE